jgi:serine/threonine-protein kinase
MIGRTLSHYRIVRPLGAGGMGVVYLAHDDHLDREVALKILPPGSIADQSARRRFRNEAQALSRLNHPHIATIYDFDTAGDVDFLVMEYVPGTTLDRMLADRPLSEADAVGYALQITDALAEAHAQNIVHRDLKPANIAITLQRKVKILDFGLAKLLQGTGADRPTSRSTASTTVAGTPAYMAPEQLLGQPVDAATDLYALGVVLFESLTGRLPFIADSPYALGKAILDERPPSVRHLRPALSTDIDTVVNRCLEKDRARRFHTSRELAAALRVLLQAHARGKPPGLSKAIRGLLAGVGALVVIGAVLLGMNAWGVRDRLLHRTIAGPIRSLAVLPLENLSKDPGQEYFADGMTDELISTLANLAGLRVISRTSVMRYKAARKSLPQVARELGVEAVIEGSVMRVGTRVRITTQLVRAATDEPLWSQSYERDLSDVLTLQRQVAQAIAREIQLAVSDQQRARFSQAAPVDPQAQESYLKGRYHATRPDEESLRASLDYYQQAIQEDPKYALAYAGLADSYILLTNLGGLSGDFGFSRAKTAARKALELDQLLAEAHSALAYAKLSQDLDWAGAEVEFKRALEINPSYATAYMWYSRLLSALGQHEQAITLATRAKDLDPVSLGTRLSLGITLFYARRYDRAVDELQQILEMDSSYVWVHSWLGLAFEQLGKSDRALIEFSRAYGGASNAASAHTLAIAGRREEARRILESLRASNPAGSRSVSPFELAMIYAGLGEKERAFVELDRAVAGQRAGLLTLGVEPALDPLHDDPRFRRLLDKLGVPR